MIKLYPAISDLRQLRMDGKVISAGMTQTDIWNLSGSPVRIKSLLWLNDDKDVQVESKHGLLAKVVPSGRYVAVMFAVDEAWTSSRLEILNSDGSLHLRLPDEFLINNSLTKCNFGWFTDAFVAKFDAFGVVVTIHRIRGDYDINYQIDLSADDGSLIRVHETR